MSKSKKIVWAGLCGLTLLFTTSCKEKTAAPVGGGYKTLTLSLTDKTLQSKYSATIQGKQDVSIYPQVSGLLPEVRIDEGAPVQKGQTLFVIDQVPYKAKVATARANVRSAEAAVATAKMTAESKQELRRENVVSDFDLQTAINDLNSAEAALAQAQAELVNAENDLSYTEIKSPVDGTAGMTAYRIGALVNSTTPLLTVSDNDEMYVYFSLTEKQVLYLSRTEGGQKNILASMPQVELLLNDGSTYEHKGRVDAVSGIIDPKTGSVTLRAVFPNPDRVLRSGGAGNILFPYERHDCIVIPQEATYELQDKVFVYKVVDGKTQSTPVTVFSIHNGTEYIVESGLKAGDVIIAEGAGLLRDGIEIQGGAAL